METALLAFLGIIVGAFLQYLFGKHLDHLKHLRDLRTQSYTDYLTGVSKQANTPRKKDLTVMAPLFAELADAKCRVCLYGSEKVIEAFAQFENLGAAMNSPAQRNAFTKMVYLMRVDSGRKGKARFEDLQVVLLGNRENNKQSQEM